MEINFNEKYQIEYENLSNKLKSYMPKLDEARLLKAFEIAVAAHDGQKRKTGEEYIIHPFAVANIIADIGIDLDSVIAGLLHDCIEDTKTGYDEIAQSFGADVADLVQGVTKLGKISYSSKEEQQVENLRKMILAMAKDVRVILIKLADRLHNMRTIDVMPEQKRRTKALETMEVYSPLAHRLGMSKIKIELEDISIKYLDPIGYRELMKSINQKRVENIGFVDKIKDEIAIRLNGQNIKHSLEGRTKHIYSIYRKVYGQGKNLDEIYDIFAVRIIVDSVIDCYNTLGVIHDIYTPIPGRFKDYISTPKPNMYQSLHTTLIGKDGLLFEVQIRTWDMHKTAEYGIAAHWKYKSGVEGGGNNDEKLAWIRQLLEVQKDTLDPEDFMRTIKIDMFSDEVFVFTPNGDVINLPIGSTAIDFAYAIHSGVGNKMNGAKVNGRITPIDYNLKNGDIVEILKGGNNSGPSLDWLKIVKTAGAKNKIRQWFKKEKREENIIRGKEELEKELRRNGIKMEQFHNEQILPQILKKFHVNNEEELFASIGFGGIPLHTVVIRVEGEIKKLADAMQAKKPEFVAEKITEQIDRSRNRKKSQNGIMVEGVDNIMIKFAKCCNPLPGDEIIGFITKGFGVSVHKKDCQNVISSIIKEEESGRWISVAWEKDVDSKFESTISIIARDRISLLADIVNMLSNMRLALHNLNSRENKEGFANITVTIDIDNVEQLNNVIKKLSKIDGVIDIIRGVL